MYYLLQEKPEVEISRHASIPSPNFLNYNNKGISNNSVTDDEVISQLSTQPSAFIPNDPLLRKLSLIIAFLFWRYFIAFSLLSLQSWEGTCNDTLLGRQSTAFTRMITICLLYYHLAEIYQKVVSGVRPYFRPSLDSSDCPSGDLANVIRKGWSEDPAERPDFQALKGILRRLNK